MSFLWESYELAQKKVKDLIDIPLAERTEDWDTQLEVAEMTALCVKHLIAERSRKNQ